MKPRRVLGFVSLLGPWLVLAAVVALVWPVQFGGSTGFAIVSGKSMERTYHTGDLVITKKRSSYKLGQVIVYAIPGTDTGHGRQVVHRLRTRLPDGKLLAQGDNNRTVDPWTITEDDIVGSKWLMIPKGGLFLGFLRSPAAAAMLIGGLVMWVVWPRKDDDEEDSEEETKSVPVALDRPQAFVGSTSRSEALSTVGRRTHWLDDDGITDVSREPELSSSGASTLHWLDDDGISDVWVSLRGRAAALVAELSESAELADDVGAIDDGTRLDEVPTDDDTDDWLSDANLIRAFASVGEAVPGMLRPAPLSSPVRLLPRESEVVRVPEV